MLSHMHVNAREVLDGVVKVAAAPLGVSAHLLARLGGHGDQLGGRPDPVILVHGCFASSAHMLTGWRTLRAAGWSNVSTHGYVAQFGDLDRLAGSLSDRIIRTAHDANLPVHVVGWSLGGLMARWAAEVQGLGVGGSVASVTTLSTPHHGTPLAKLSRFAGPLASQVMREMIPGSPTLARLAETGDDSDPARYRTFGSVHDLVVADSAATMDGVAHHTLSGVGHLGIVSDVAVWERVVEGLRVL